MGEVLQSGNSNEDQIAPNRVKRNLAVTAALLIPVEVVLVLWRYGSSAWQMTACSTSPTAADMSMFFRLVSCSNLVLFEVNHLDQISPFRPCGGREFFVSFICSLTMREGGEA
jgi:hypothetical protein